VRLLVRLHGDSRDLALSEAETLAGAPVREMGTPYRPSGFWGPRRWLLAEAPDWHALARMGLASLLLEHLGEAQGPALPFDPAAVVAGPYAVVPHHQHVLPERERELSRQLIDLVWHGLSQPRVDLAWPLTELHVVLAGEQAWWGRLLHRFERSAFEWRTPRRRPFWRSISMEPRRSRALVNLSAVRPGERLLDPFCGTGSYVIEAALLGAHALGSDVDPRVAAGARRNLAHVGAAGDVRVLDARRLEEWGTAVDAIVTDLPYGRSATLLLDSRRLYAEFLGAAAGVVRPGGRIVVVHPKGELPAAPPSLRVVRRLEEVVHDSLTREVHVLER
jgi:putative methyltransferase (TIGR01177 family)